MRISLKAVIGVLMLFCTFSAGALTFAELEKEVVAVEAGQRPDEMIFIRLADITEAFTVYTKALYKKKTTTLLFCIPRGTQMNINQVISMIRRQAKIDKVSQGEMVQNILLRAYESQFPCSVEAGS